MKIISGPGDKVVIERKAHFEPPVISKVKFVPAGGLLPVLPSMAPDVLALLLSQAVCVGPGELAGSIGMQA